VSKRLGEYVPLSVNYADDDAILALSPMAELLFIRCLSLAGRLKSDGFISDTQIIQRAARGLGSQRRVRVLITELVTAGPLERQDGGYVIRAWLRWNKSADQLGRELARDRERKRADRQSVPSDSERNPDGVPSESERNPDLSERSPASRAPARAEYGTALHGTVRHDTETPAAEVVNSSVEGTSPAESNGSFDVFATDPHGKPDYAPEFEAERRRQMDALMAMAREETP
jgi:hypothetical protein